MLNEDKLKLMTSLALFEKAEDKRLTLVKRYYKSDYISKGLLRSFLGYNFCWAIGLAMMILCRLNEILAAVTLAEFTGFFAGYISWYLIGLAVYLIITFCVYYRRYTYAARGMKVYLSKMKRLEKRYEFQDRLRGRGKEGRKT